MGWQFEAPVADMPVYLRYLVVRLAEAGVPLDVGTVDSLRATAKEAPVVVNCSGLGARELAEDGDVVPVRGQIVVVENPGIDCYFGEHSDDDNDQPTYIIPHGDYVVLGGTAELGRSDTLPDLAAAAAIVSRCAAVEPRLGQARVVSHRVGIRPVRSTIRLERDPDDGNVIHNYGHGGSGFSTVWGCAYEVTRLVHDMLGA
jgi:D-amino-acid oxidase